VHRIIDATIDLAKKEDLKPDRIERIVAHVGKVQDTMVRHKRPATALQAKFSVEFAVAGGIAARRVGLRELTDDFVNRAEIQNLIGRVSREITEETDPDMETYPYFDWIDVTLKDGKTLMSEKVARAKGHAHNPIESDELWAKFDDCLSEAFPAERRRALFEKLQKIESLSSARALYR
jgi:2-methylcitrate dehydratase PrpD